jgi:hypothetical protein
MVEVLICYQRCSFRFLNQVQRGETIQVIRLAAFADFVSTYKYCAYPLDLHIERGRNIDATSYPPGYMFINNYSDEELREAFY